MEVTEIIQKNKTRYVVKTDASIQFPLYKRELNLYNLEIGSQIEDALWEQICSEVLYLRAKKRALHLLEKMDRTESQLRRKLKENDYPDEVIDVAIAYVASFHYIDDLRYAQTYIRYHQETKSRIQLMTTLLQRGISKDLIQQALEEEYSQDESVMIRKLLEKKHFRSDMEQKEKQKIFQYLARKGYGSEAIRRCMNMEFE